MIVAAPAADLPAGYPWRVEPPYDAPLTDVDHGLPHVRTNEFVWGVNGHPLTGRTYMKPDELEEQFSYLDSLRVTHYRIDVYVDTLGNDVRPAGVSFADVLDVADRHGITIVPVIGDRPDIVDRPGAQAIDINYRAGYRLGNVFAAKYGNRVTHVAAGNELEYLSLHPGQDGTELSQYDSATLALTTAFIRGLARGIRDRAPSTRIIIEIGGRHYAFFDALRRDSVDYDVIGSHWYSGTGPGDIDSPMNAGKSFLDQLIALGKDIWITEVNRQYGSLRETPSDSQAFWITKYVRDYYKLEQIKGFFVYELYDDPPNVSTEAHYGLITCSADLSGCISPKVMKPAFNSYRYGIEEQVHGYEDYVYWLFTHVLRKAPDPTELTSWTNRFVALGRESAWNKSVFVERFVREQNSTFIKDQYERILGREPDANALTYWARQLSHGAARRNLILNLCDSREFWLLSGGTAEGFVNRLYGALLRREPTPPERSRHLAQLAIGTLHEDVIKSIITSYGYYSSLVDEQSYALHGELPDSITRAQYIERMQNGLTQEGLLVVLLSRNEVWNAALTAGYQRRVGGEAYSAPAR